MHTAPTAPVSISVHPARSRWHRSRPPREIQLVKRIFPQSVHRRALWYKEEVYLKLQVTVNACEISHERVRAMYVLCMRRLCNVTGCLTRVDFTSYFKLHILKGKSSLTPMGSVKYLWVSWVLSWR